MFLMRQFHSAFQLTKHSLREAKESKNSTSCSEGRKWNNQSLLHAKTFPCRKYRTIILSSLKTLSKSSESSKGEHILTEYLGRQRYERCEDAEIEPIESSQTRISIALVKATHLCLGGSRKAKPFGPRTGTLFLAPDPTEPSPEFRLFFAF
ncbi:expressed unknown protein [Seminavis robusta]|uniref:Uncharacterized protein n=1 Tax=Seminavis robusta TaxID=568900 RepID=A0A9N8DZV4_9STRA|nr:expressed unknown protein [Seminavis robusta]|eukprot:Sro398_g134611.1  (151) ;mRNA; r:14579-15031